MDLLVGCPVAHRAWIMPRWFAHARAAAAKAGLVPHFVFVGAPPLDRETFDAIMREYQDGPEEVFVINSGEAHLQKTRFWGPTRYAHMAVLRNQLLRAVRRAEPKLFLSLDSDILLHEDALANMIETSERFDAVGGRCYMTPTGMQFPSYGMWKRDGGVRRAGDFTGAFKVDCIMAVKLMKPVAYAVDYEPHQFGEDIGWSRACKNAGVTLGWDGRVISKHVLEQEMLDRVDPRLGW